MRRLLPVLIVALLVVGGGWSIKTFLFTDDTPRNILLMGLDEGRTRTDVLIVARIDPKLNHVALLSIPRDTLAEIDCTGIKFCQSPDKIAHAHVYGGERGAQVTRKTVEKLLGIRIDFYVEVDYEGFERVIDTLGGVDIVIDRNMDYEDPYANPPLHIKFRASPNPQHLDGKQALNYVRFRADELGDIGRIQRTKKFFFALLETMRKKGSLTKLPSMVQSTLPYVKTDIDVESAVALARMAPRIDPARIQVDMVPGVDVRGALWVWKPDEKKLREVVDRLFINPQVEPAK